MLGLESSEKIWYNKKKYKFKLNTLLHVESCGSGNKKQFRKV